MGGCRCNRGPSVNLLAAKMAPPQIGDPGKVYPAGSDPISRTAQKAMMEPGSWTSIYYVLFMAVGFVALSLITLQFCEWLSEREKTKKEQDESGEKEGDGEGEHDAMAEKTGKKGKCALFWKHFCGLTA